MAEKIKMKISPAVARFVRPGAIAEEKLKGLEAAAEMLPNERLVLTFCLTRDSDELVKGAAAAAFSALPEEDLVEYIRHPEPHPAILDAIARFRHSSPVVVNTLLESKALSPQARVFLERLVPAKDQPQDVSADEGPSSDEDYGSDNDAGLNDELVGEEY